jgi:hypothetical protein
MTAAKKIAEATDTSEDVSMHLDADERALLARYPHLLTKALASAKTLEAIAAQDAEDAAIEAKLVPILGAEEAAIRTRERRQRVRQQRADAEEALAVAVAEAERRDRERAEREAVSAQKAAKAARLEELYSQLGVALRGTVETIHEIVSLQGSDAAWFIGREMRRERFLNVPMLSEALEHGKWMNPAQLAR